MMRKELGKIYHNIRMLAGKKKINAIWFESDNWGDALNPVLIRHLSGLRPFRIREYTINPKNEPVYMVIGSFLQTPLLTGKMLKNTIIWGTGFLSESGRLRGTPRQICAVRGPLTRDNLRASGIKCPEIYGDPALLYPRIYKPAIKKEYKLGIIPHYMDKEAPVLSEFKTDPEVRFIDIQGPINTVVDQICGCKFIASSSLHGIIAADSYGIPSVWIKLSDNVLGEGFKFRDYFRSVGRAETDPLVISKKFTPDTVYDAVYNYKIDIDLDQLLEVCPFYYPLLGI